jgi:hypothetical protein
MKPIALLVVAVFLCADAAVAQTPPNIPPNIGSIGVVTVIPPKIHIHRFGLLDTACDWLDITNLHLDKAAFDGAVRALSPRYRIIRTTVDPNAVIRTSNTEIMGMFKSFPSIGEQVRQLSHAESAVDAYLLIWSRHSENICQLTPGQVGHGFGLTKHLFDPPNLHIFAQVMLIDGRTLQPLLNVGLRPSYQRLDNFDWKDSVAALSVQQRQQINTLLSKMITDAVSATSRQALIGH